MCEINSPNIYRFPKRAVHWLCAVASHVWRWSGHHARRAVHWLCAVASLAWRWSGHHASVLSTGYVPRPPTCGGGQAIMQACCPQLCAAVSHVWRWSGLYTLQHMCIKYTIVVVYIVRPDAQRALQVSRDTGQGMLMLHDTGQCMYVQVSAGIRLSRPCIVQASGMCV